ncbi:MAG TPA: adenylate/guanylate cyclase domain-containing protein [Actinomycetota bacterium]|nr:adenylate/guanylate cyclase domain-containing protein [Actinomycetota bacterium]
MSSWSVNACPNCGAGLPKGARFCPACGAPVETAAPAPAAREEERRLVTILFVDLVGFTERSDRADPEDVHRRLVPFHARAKADIEGFGGTLDKFMGDAVMGVFGAPVAHEDDALRAVRAARRILESMAELRAADPELAVRVAVNTGEAVVSFGAGPQIGEAVAGDVVNTTSRMQSLAPANSVVIGEATLRALGGRFEVEELPPALVKGKSEPLQVWRIVREREEPSSPAPTRFVGREPELARLREAFDDVVKTSSARRVTVVGEPGIGKSRLVSEFRERVDGQTLWLVGRCLPYGEAVTFAPVVDVVQAVAGIERSDDSEVIDRKLRRFAAATQPDADERGWLVSRLEPLLGVATADQRGRIEVRETAQAWARTVAVAAGDDPLVLHLEDIHWAEPALLEAIEEMDEALAERPVLMLATARPGPMDGSDAGVATIELLRLSDDETAGLCGDLLNRLDLGEEVPASLVERAGGNPLYALEFAQMLAEHRGGTEEVPMPETVQAVIAARLDAIPPELRSVVQDASVIGPAFWPGALAALSGRTLADVTGDVSELDRRGLLTRAPASAMPGEEEYGFTHALIREVAYGRLPRIRRAGRHRVVARWIEHEMGDRADEWAESLARHYATAFELANAAGEPDVADAARGPAVRWSLAAGERAAQLDPAGALTWFERAVADAPGLTAEWARARIRTAQMGRLSGRLDGREVLRRYEEALAVYRDLGDPYPIGATLVRVGSQLGGLGESDRAREALIEAVKVLEPLPPGRELASAYAYRAEEEMFGGRVREALELSDRALDLRRDHPDDDLIIMALHIRGDARCSLGDSAGGLADLRDALRLAEGNANPHDIVTSLAYLAEWDWADDGPRAAIRHYDRAIEISKRRGLLSQGARSTFGRASANFELGEWDRSLEDCDELLSVGRELLDEAVFIGPTVLRSRILLLRGRRDEVPPVGELLVVARSLEELNELVMTLILAASVAVDDGDRDAAARCLREFRDATRDVASYYRESHLAQVVRLCVSCGEHGLAEDLVASAAGLLARDRRSIIAARAVVAEAAGDPEGAERLHAEAAESWRTYEWPFEEAMALVGRARCLDSLGRAPQAEPHRRRANEILAALGCPVSA